ncbi:MAG: DUF1016 family protein [Candidatus Delongbacteria bacterium]|nr:DUF1016 family protein [Candidatus Delongbacteria bacterium]
MKNIDILAGEIQKVHDFFQHYAYKQIDRSLTFRNWLIGCIIFEFEQEGSNRAAYGENTISLLAKKLKKETTLSFSSRSLRLHRQFYTVYPQIFESKNAKFFLAQNKAAKIWQLPIAKLRETASKTAIEQHTPIDTLLDRLSFTHFIELIRFDDPLKRAFYEFQAIKNNWSVSELKRNINSLLYERIGLSKNKEKLIAKLKKETLQTPADLMKEPYMLEFIGMEERSEYSETQMEQAIIDHLHKFLMEMGRGFCFEARQKRITFNNRHYKIDLVFYHRILKCHVLIDLKIGEFDHADAGQMNLYLNYYKENEMAEGDNLPIGIILCSEKDSTLVHYATGGLSQEVFVGKYMLQLPKEDDLKNLVREDIAKYGD